MRVSALAFACHEKACAPPPAGRGGSSPTHKKSQVGDAISRALEQVQRTEPGRGVNANPEPDAPATIKQKSIPNLPTERLERALAHIHQTIHTPEGLHAWDNPRRGLIEYGVKAKAIAHELRLRGMKPGDCKHCWSGIGANNASY